MKKVEQLHNLFQQFDINCNIVYGHSPEDYLCGKILITCDKYIIYAKNINDFFKQFEYEVINRHLYINNIDFTYKYFCHMLQYKKLDQNFIEKYISLNDIKHFCNDYNLEFIEDLKELKNKINSLYILKHLKGN